jgi:hypothetical protein
MDVLSLLQSKKKCLRRILALAEGFAEVAEQGGLSQLEVFENQRGAAFKTLALIDRKITEAVRSLSTEERSPALSVSVRRSLDDEEFLIQSILNADNRILQSMEREKERLTREVNATYRSKELAGRFKSAWIPESGEGLDKKV